MIETKAKLIFIGSLAIILGLCEQKRAWSDPRRPNIIYVMLDDAGYGDFGAMGSQMVKTPAFDQLCREGMRFTDHYSGSAVCAPTRCVLMTGLHTGHCRRRDNRASAKKELTDQNGLIFLKETDVTVAEVLKQSGYRTGAIGKWGLGNPGSSGVPWKQGFDYFFGYLDQVHAHDHFTDHLFENADRYPTDKQYSHYLFEEKTLEFISRNQQRPFFLYLPFCLPHGKYVIPEDDAAHKFYEKYDWPQQVKNYAAMITRADKTVGRLLEQLDALGISEDTIIFYTSDNGPNSLFVQHLNSNGPFRGIKRTLWEGGLRAPMAVRWPGRISANTVSNFICGMRDFFPTACDLANIQVSRELDGVSMLPTLMREQKPVERAMYWEFPGGSQQAVRVGKWKGMRQGTQGAIRLYDLSVDPQEKDDVAKDFPVVVAEVARVMEESHVDSPFYPLQEKVTRQYQPLRQASRLQ